AEGTAPLGAQAPAEVAGTGPPAVRGARKRSPLPGPFAVAAVPPALSGRLPAVEQVLGTLHRAGAVEPVAEDVEIGAVGDAPADFVRHSNTPHLQDTKDAPGLTPGLAFGLPLQVLLLEQRRVPREVGDDVLHQLPPVLPGRMCRDGVGADHARRMMLLPGSSSHRKWSTMDSTIRRSRSTTPNSTLLDRARSVRLALPRSAVCRSAAMNLACKTPVDATRCHTRTPRGSAVKASAARVDSSSRRST